MAIYARVTKIMTTDFAEISILDGIDGEPIDETTYIAEFEGKKDNVRRDDIVEVVTVDNRIMNESRIAYILPVVGAVLGFLFTAGKATGERLLSAFLLALMLFIVAWVTFSCDYNPQRYAASQPRKARNFIGQQI